MKKEYWIIIVIITALVFGFLFLNIKNRKNPDVNSVDNSLIQQDMQSTDNIKNESTQSSTVKKTYSKVPDIIGVSQITNSKARMNTAKGEIVVKFFSDAPQAASNFITLAKDGFYDGLTFHRREEGFVIQGGDPIGNGTGGPGYKFNDEPVTRDYNRGIVAMANSGPNTNGSQFFIMLADTPLPKQYTIFGEVVSGIDVVDKIAVGDVISKITIE